MSAKQIHRREDVLPFIVGAKLRGEDPRDLVILSLDPAVPQLDACARGLSASLFFDRSPGELAFAPFVFALSKARALAFLEAQKLIAPADGSRLVATIHETESAHYRRQLEEERKSLAAEFAALQPGHVMVIRLEDRMPPLMRRSTVDANDAPPPAAEIRPRYVILEAPSNSQWGAAGQVINEPLVHFRMTGDRFTTCDLRTTPGYRLSPVLPFEIRRQSGASVEWHRLDAWMHVELDTIAVPMFGEELEPDERGPRYRALSLEERDEIVRSGDRVRRGLEKRAAWPVPEREAPAVPEPAPAPEPAPEPASAPASAAAQAAPEPVDMRPFRSLAGMGPREERDATKRAAGRR